MVKSNTIIIVDDNKGVLSALKILLKDIFSNIITLLSPEPLPSFIREADPSVILLDMNFKSGLNTGNEGLYWLHEIKKINSSLPVVLFTAYADIDLAVKGIKDGASDFVVKPCDNDKLIATLLNAIANKTVKRKKNVLPVQSMFWGNSNKMQDIRELIDKVAATDANILITGENGTGKEMLAKEIHRLSNRSDNMMVSVDVGSLTETLFESELFGHEKGAFTDAKSEKSGKFEQADGSTLFLDEIANIPLRLQAKLLTVIQSRKVMRIGSNKAKDVDIRLISATNCNLQDNVSKGIFREDLLYRINTIHIEIPPLRERKEDIAPLASLFIKKYISQYNKAMMTLSDMTLDKMMRYPWYGNIRELEHMVEKAVIISDSQTINDSCFHFPKKMYIPSASTEVSTLEDMEQRMIKKTLDKCDGNLSAVASQLGITRQTLYNKMKKFGL